MNKDQTTGVAERILYGVAMGVLAKLVARGYIDEDMAAYIAAGFVSAVGAGWAWWINRPKALVQAAAAVPGTTVITQPALAASTSEANIVSSDATKAVAK